MLDWYVIETLERFNRNELEGQRNYSIREALADADPRAPGALAHFENWLGSLLVARGRELQRQSGLERPVPNSQAATVAGMRATSHHVLYLTMAGAAPDVASRPENDHGGRACA